MVCHFHHQPTRMEEVAHDVAASSEACAPRKVTYDRLLLPVIKLKNAASSKQFEQRLNYLWSSAHAMITTSPALAHNMAATILETARANRLQLPAAVLDYLCPQCGGLTVPSISADVRVVPQHHKTKMNRKLAQLQRKQSTVGAARRELLQNVLRIQCHRCGFQNLRHGASVVHKPKAKKTTNKRPLDQEAALVVEAKRAKMETIESNPVAVETKEDASTEVEANAVKVDTAPQAPRPVAAKKEEEKPRSIFAKPPSPPRKLLDGKKKKKKPAAKDAAAAAQVKSSLDSFLSTLKK